MQASKESAIGPRPGDHLPCVEGRDAGMTSAGAVVVTITLIVTLVVVAVSTAEAEGLNVHEAPVGNPVQPRVTVPVKPFTAVTVALKLPDPPWLLTVTEGLEDVI